MNSASLVAPVVADLEAIAAVQPAAWPFVAQLREAGSRFSTCAPLVLAAAQAARLGTYRTVALLLKLLATEGASRRGTGFPASDRCSWEHELARLRELGFVGAELPAAEFELLVIEQHALAAESLGVQQVATLAAQHEHERSLLAEAGAAERAEFVGDKRSWLLEEIQLDDLLALHEDLVKEIESTRMQYLAIAGRAAIELVEAAHRLALLRYRVALDDPTLTPVELRLCLQRDLFADREGGTLVFIEPELRQALLDTEGGARADYQLLLELEELRDAGRLRPASREERKEAELEFRRLARLIFPDALAQHPQYAEIDPRNKQRLEEIWCEASGTHRARVHLSRDRLLDFLANLRRWKAEVEHILRHLAFPMPSLLLLGDTLDERRADLRRAMSDVQRHQHAVRDEIAAREFDPQHGEYRRVIALDEEGRCAERQRMTALAEAWNAEARQLAAKLEAREGGTAADAPPAEPTKEPRPQPGQQQP